MGDRTLKAIHNHKHSFHQGQLKGFVQLMIWRHRVLLKRGVNLSDQSHGFRKVDSYEPGLAEFFAAFILSLVIGKLIYR